MSVQSNRVADYFGVDASIEPFIPELLADFFDLGGFPEQIVELLRPLDLPGPRTRALDLGCGKGAVSIAIAEKLGFQVDGIDLMEAFIEEAKQKAEQHKVSNRCHFERLDLTETVDQKQGYHVVLLISVGSVLGDIDETVGKLRETIAAGGYMVIDDGYLKPGVTVDFPGYEHCHYREGMLSQLTAFGDRVVTEHRVPIDATKAQNRRYLKFILSRVKQLSKEYPQHASAFDRYVRKERAEIEILENRLIGATWVLQK